jgi:GNAT superfamily N-acetyltransferase
MTDKVRTPARPSMTAIPSLRAVEHRGLETPGAGGEEKGVKADGAEASHREMVFERAARAAISWAAGEGWDPGLDDARRFLAADPYAFLATEREGEIVATVSCALYGDSYAFIGFYIVRPDLRGNGIGSSLFDRALERADGRVVGLDGVPAQQGSYERRGFVLAYRNVRWRTVGGGERPDSVVELSSVPIEQLVAFDGAVFGSTRERFLRAWIDRPAGHALACLRGGGLAGYGVLRPCRSGSKIGPLFADDPDVADALLTGLLAAAGPGTEVFIDMPDANARAAELRARRAMEPSFETARMYLNGRPPEDVRRVFGVTTLELG